MNQKQIDYKKKMKLHATLGAKEFKKIVMAVEKARWTFTKKYWPNYLEEYEKKVNRACKKALKHAKNANQRREITNYYRYQILQARKEFNTEKNSNYHINFKRPTDVNDYLNWNKMVHINGLLIDLSIFSIAMGFIGAGVGVEIAATGLGLAIIDGVINWQCINLQEYNLCRLNIHKNRLEQLEARREEKIGTNFGEATKVIQKAFDDTKDTSRVPTPTEIVSKINNPEQLRQLKNLIEKTYNIHNALLTEDANGKGVK